MAQAVLDLATWLWGRAPHLPYDVYYHAMSTLPDGKLILTGGNTDGGATDRVMLFDPETNRWTEGPPMGTKRYRHSQSVLQNGNLLVCGGHDGSNVLKTAEVYDHREQTWTPVKDMDTPLNCHAQTTMRDGRVLVAAGHKEGHKEKAVVSSCSIYDDEADEWEKASDLPEPRHYHSLSTLPDGRLLACGVSTNAVTPPAAYTPEDDAWAHVEAGIATYYHGASQLPDGRVVLTGGYDESKACNRTRVFDPTTTTWSEHAKCYQPRYHHAQATLRDGRVMIVGGYINGKQGRSAWIWGPPQDAAAAAAVGAVEDQGQAPAGAPPAYPADQKA
eukprot:m.357179 g.357179  ORF g.357179 m.357179 type:complete len:331 (+) comp16613_c0_seq2:40-1032(+)